MARAGLRWEGALALAAALAASAAGASELTLADPAGGSVRWSDWVGAHGPAAVVVWASWAPGGRDLGSQLDGLAAAARDKQLELVVVSVQESAESAARQLERVRVTWLHDRHGAILKEYRLIRVPTLIVVDQDASVLARLEPTAEALRAWQR